MKRAAGLDDVGDVIERFRTQGKTSEILDIQNEKSKDDVMKLSQAKEQLQNEWEKVRFVFPVNIFYSHPSKLPSQVYWAE